MHTTGTWASMAMLHATYEEYSGFVAYASLITASPSCWHVAKGAKNALKQAIHKCLIYRNGSFLMQAQASSPWPDVIMASQLDCAPKFSDPQRRFPNDFRVEMPQSQLAENSSPHDHFPATSSSDSPPDDRPQRNLQRGVDMYSAQECQPGKVSSHE